MAPSLDSIVKRLMQLEKAQGLTTKLAVQTDLDVQRERVRNQVVFHLRGDLLGKMEELYKEPGLDGALKLVASRGDETKELFRNQGFRCRARDSQRAVPSGARKRARLAWLARLSQGSLLWIAMLS